MNNKVPHFYYSENKIETPGAGFITSTVEPHLIGKILKFDNEHDLNSFIIGKAEHEFAKVEGYMIVIQTWNAGVNPSISVMENLHNRTKELRNMAAFYYLHTIKPKLSYYYRYLDNKTR